MLSPATGREKNRGESSFHGLPAPASHALVKRCTKCGEEKSRDLFPNRKKSKDGLGYKCLSCAALETRLWRAANRDYHRHSVREWQRANKELVNQRSKEWRLKNKERRAKTCREWNERNQDKRAEAVARRRGKLVTPGWAEPTAIAAFYREAKRLEKETGVKHHVDHIVPINSLLVCGLHVENNLQVIPALENVQKRNLIWPDMP